MDWLDPAGPLALAKERVDIVQRLIPDKGIAWAYGPSMSFKTFVAMSLSVAVSKGEPWFGHQTPGETLVIYVGAEGGIGLHARRAAAEGGEIGNLVLLSERPRVDTTDGAEALRGYIHAFTGAFTGREGEVFAAAHAKYADWDVLDRFASIASVLVVIDTYSQTSGGDEKENVSAYVKNLRDVIDECGDLDVSVLVIDHATKAGGTYLGSVAKLNDVDSLLELSRDGERVCVRQVKSKDSSGSPPFWLEMVSVQLPYTDAYGAKITTLVAQDGEKAKRLAEVAEGHAGTLLALVGDWRGERELRAAFIEKVGGRRESAAKAYKRAMERLAEIGAVVSSGGVVKRT